MTTKYAVHALSIASGLAIALSLSAPVGCEKKPTPAPTNGTAPTGPQQADHGHDHDDHAHGDDHDHAHDDDHDHSHGPTTQLGEQVVGALKVKASRDGDITPGGDVPIDVWVTANEAGATIKPSAVRIWIGTQDAKGSVKAKAELEKDNWHTHVEIPEPMPVSSMLWIEIETEGAPKVVVGFDLKR